MARLASFKAVSLLATVALGCCYCADAFFTSRCGVDKCPLRSDLAPGWRDVRVLAPSANYPILAAPRERPGGRTQIVRSSAASGAENASREEDEGAADSAAATPPSPTTFREAEVSGLRLMQQGRYKDALGTFKDALKLPGSRTDVVRTQTVGGPSPVGGAAGGRTGQTVESLDEFEMQAAHYNIACAYSCLGDPAEAVANLKIAFDCGFDNFATVRVDPDLRTLDGTPEFERLMEDVDPKRKGFLNPFRLFGK